MLIQQAEADSNITVEQIQALESTYPSIKKFLK
jgi:uncharacterized membrane protein